MWKCPKCGHSFKNTNQRHHCERTTAAAQLKTQPEVIVEIHDRLLDVVKKIGIFSVSPIKDYIMLKHKSTFLTIKPRKKYLDISFFLPEKTEEFPIFASLQQSKNAYCMQPDSRSPLTLRSRLSSGSNNRTT